MIVGFVGLIGSGKDTAADHLVTAWGFKRDSFANSLKDAVADIFHWDRELLQGQTAESRAWREQVDDWWAERLGIPHLTPRWVLQFFGTDVCRDYFSNDIWVASLERKLMQSKDNVVISDVRFPNEIHAIKDAGGVIIRLQRGDNPIWWSTARKDALAMDRLWPEIHASEWSWICSGEDYVVHNDGSIADLCMSLNKVIDSMQGSSYNSSIDKSTGVL
jgi:hypothetical protein